MRMSRRNRMNFLETGEKKNEFRMRMSRRNRMNFLETGEKKQKQNPETDSVPRNRFK
jgi:hypothetical protein